MQWVNYLFVSLTGLNLEQVDTLWNCLVDNQECSDDLLSWFLNQAKSKEHHAMSLETFKHIFMEKVITKLMKYYYEHFYNQLYMFKFNTQQ